MWGIAFPPKTVVCPQGSSLSLQGVTMLWGVTTPWDVTMPWGLTTPWSVTPLSLLCLPVPAGCHHAVGCHHTMGCHHAMGYHHAMGCHHVILPCACRVSPCHGVSPCRGMSPRCPSHSGAASSLAGARGHHCTCTAQVLGTLPASDLDPTRAGTISRTQISCRISQEW